MSILPKPSLRLRFALLLCAVAGWLVGSSSALAADPLVEGAVTALAALTNPGRLETLGDEEQFRAQLGPALGWLHVARRRDVSPEAVIVRAFAANGLNGERARLTRDSLLKNLARADAWELFANEASAQALANGRPAPILAGIHRGHVARAAVVPPMGNAGNERRDFAWLVLSADDEPAPRRTKPYRPQPGDLLARRRLNPATDGKKERPATRRTLPQTVSSPVAAPVPNVYDEPLPAP